MSFRVLGLDPSLFNHYTRMSDSQLRRVGAVRMSAGAESDFPCRVTLRNIPAGETALLLNHQHQPANSPYRSSGPIFIWEDATERHNQIDELPTTARPRLYSLRGYTADSMMVEADLAEGAGMAVMIENFLADPLVSYLHAHHARRGCYAFLIERA